METEELNMTVSDNQSNSTGPGIVLLLDPKRVASLSTAYGLLHIFFVVIPVLVIGPIILHLIRKNFKKSDSATSVVFIYIVLLCTIGPSTVSFLLDLSLITDLPFAGGCNLPLFRFYFSFGQIILFVCTAQLSVTQYAVLRLGSKKLAVVSISLVVALSLIVAVSSSPALLLSTYSTLFKVRGSFCAFLPGSLVLLINNTRVVAYVVIFWIPSFILVVIFSTLTYRFVKRNTIENARVVKGVLKIMIIYTVAAVIFRVAPVISFAIDFTPHDLLAVELVQTLFAEMNYPLHLIVILFVHKTVREAFVKKLKTIIGKLKTKLHIKRSPVFNRESNRVAPATAAPTTVALITMTTNTS